MVLSAGIASGQAPRAAGDSSFQAFLPQWETAQRRFINGDPALWKERASHEADITIFGAFGGREKGWAEVGPRNDWASSHFKDAGSRQTIEYLSVATSGDLAVTVSIERQVAQLVEQSKPTARNLRVTQVFRRERGAWKLLHRHADPLVERVPPGRRR
jgi:ketosteroid isomerase-like protein